MNIFKSIKRNLIKRNVINSILGNEQHNNDVVNIHRIDKKNIGDFYCAPHHYFDILKGKSLDIFDYKSEDIQIRNHFINEISNRSLIIGGGGLLNRDGFVMQMKMFEKLTGKGKKIVLWGVGHNEKSPKTYGKVSNYNIDINKFGLVGTRDYNMPGEYVPCVSCLHPIMDTKLDVVNEVGVIFHKKTLKDKSLLNKLSNYPSSSNTLKIEEIINFISQTDTVVTDSYHAMYWSMLLGKKVVALPNSSKFYSFKYKPAFSDFKNFENEIKNAPRYSGVLDECKEINMKFSEKVFDYLNL